MVSQWVKLTPQNKKDGDCVHVNLDNVSSVWPHKDGSRIWFLAGDKDGVVDVEENPDAVAEHSKDLRNANRT